MIGVIDSGVGGLNVVLECLKLFDEEFVFLCDNKNAPYGNKNKFHLYKIIKKNISFLINRYHCKTIILACNTISSMFYHKLKKEFFEIKLIPTFPPFGIINKQKKDVLFFGTKNTLKFNKKINNLIKNNNNFKGLHIKNLPKLIDENVNNLDIVVPILKQNFARADLVDVKTIVLCCTHFRTIEDQIKKSFPLDVKVFSYENEVAKKVKLFANKEKNTSHVDIFLTSNNNSLYVKLKCHLLNRMREIDKL